MRLKPVSPLPRKFSLVLLTVLVALSLAGSFTHGTVQYELMRISWSGLLAFLLVTVITEWRSR